jgi:hypothetical protein
MDGPGIPTDGLIFSPFGTRVTSDIYNPPPLFPYSPFDPLPPIHHLLE